MQIRPSSLSLQRFFVEAREQFVIPAYQRRYAWGTRQQWDLFQDLLSLEQNDNHLLGTIVFLTQAHRPGINRLELVDGQQRLTSLTLLVKALADRFRRETEAGDDLADSYLRDTQTYLSCKDGDRRAHPKLLLGDLDHSDYLAIMNGTDLSDVRNKSLLAAYDNFTKWVGDLSLQELYAFFEKLMSNTAVIRLDVSQAKDAYKLFEMINNRGLRLQPTDTIKNFILGHAAGLLDDTLKSVKTDWQKLIVALDGLNADDFLRQWLAGKLHRKVSKNKLVSDFRGYYSRRVVEAKAAVQYEVVDDAADDADDEVDTQEVQIEDLQLQPAVDATPIRRIKLVSFVKEMRVGAELYARIRHADMQDVAIDRSLVNLRRINTLPAVTWLLDLFSRGSVDRKTKMRLLKALEAFMMRRHICSRRTNELESIFASMAALPDQRYENLVFDKLREHTPPDTEFEERFAKYEFAPALIDRARYALEQIEYHLHHGHGEMAVADPSVVEVEHIIPKAANKPATKKEFGDWPTYLGADWTRGYEKSLHRIGNLTLLSGSLNVAASNNPFLAKKEEYKKSSIKITNQLGKLNQFRLNAVQKRSEEFSKLAVKIWRV